MTFRKGSGAWIRLAPQYSFRVVLAMLLSNGN